jgi:hypothetical protein
MQMLNIGYISVSFLSKAEMYRNLKQMRESGAIIRCPNYGHRWAALRNELTMVFEVNQLLLHSTTQLLLLGRAHFRKCKPQPGG